MCGCVVALVLASESIGVKCSLQDLRYLPQMKPVIQVIILRRVVANAYARPCRLGRELGVDPEVILATSHGRRTIDTLKLYDLRLANWECE